MSKPQSNYDLRGISCSKHWRALTATQSGVQGPVGGERNLLGVGSVIGNALDTRHLSAGRALSLKCEIPDRIPSRGGLLAGKNKQWHIGDPKSREDCTSEAVTMYHQLNRQSVGLGDR